MKLFYKSMIFLLIVGISLMAFGQAPTAAGTNIVNVATATFTDSNGTNRNSQSNPVTTVVQAVYNFNVEPDNNNDPGPAGGAGAAANSGDNDFSLDPDPSNNKTANAGDTVILEYNIENLSNTAIDVGLTMASDPANTLSPSSVELYVDDDPTTADGADTNGDGIPDNYVLYNPAAKPNIPRNDGTSGSGDDFLKVFAKIVLPANALGNEVAKFDLQATNDTAVADGKTGDNISYENNNIGRIEINEHPSIGAAKAITDTRNLHDGTYEVDYTVTLENFGNVDLSYVQATEDLATTFGAATAWSVKAGTLASGDFTVDAAFDGNANKKLLTVAAGNALAVGASGTITFTVVVEPGASLGSYDNSVTAQGTSPDDEAAPGFDNTNPTASTTDNSVDGLDPDHDATDDTTDGSTDDDGTPNEQSPTQITFTENPVLGVAKSATASVDAVGFPGQFETDITFTVENLGDVELRNLQVTDDLDTTFAAPVTYSVVSITSANLTENASFNGSADKNLLTGVDTLAVGQTETIVIKVRYDPNGATGPFNNQATGTAISPGSPLGGGGNPTVNVTDDSTDGTNPDPNDNDNPDENTPTPISFTEVGSIGVAKNLDSITDAGAGLFDATFTITVENLGNVDLSNVQVAEDLAATFPAPATFTLTSVTSVGLSVDAGFTGTAPTTNLLVGNDSLAPAQVETIVLVVQFDPNGATGFNNQVTASGETPSGATVTDTSDDGTEPDADGDGNGNEAGENDPTPINIPESPSIGAAKAITDTRNLHDGTYEVDYTVTLENFGNVDLSYVQATEDLATTFGAATAWSVKAGTLASGDFTVDAAFDGNANKKLLTVAAGNALAVGASGTITFTVVVEPGASLGSYDNSVTAQGTSPDDEAAPGFDNTNPTASTTDNSVDGLDPDHDATDDTTDGSTDDDGTPNEQSPTQITFTENPVLGVAKSATASVDAVGFPGQFETDITFTVENLGDVELRNLQVTDDLDTTFAAPVTYSVVSITSANLTENASFNGSADKNLLTGVDTLAVGQTETIVIKVRYDPNGATGPFNNQATGTAISPGSPLGGGGNPTVNVTDDSTDGTNPDPNDNDNPDENTPTPISFTENPVVGVAKAATVVDADTDNDPTTVGPYDVRLDFVITNYGNVNISNLALTDDLTAVGNFGAGNYTVTSAPSFRVAPPATSTINLNAGYNGDADIALVAAGSNLDVGDSATISITVHLTTPGAYKNEADVAGQSPAGVVVTDDSTNGANPDPNSDGNPSSGDPGNPNEDEPTPINLDALQLVKSHRVCADADCTTVVDATGATVEPGQYIEYTIVASNVGGQGLTDVVIFDEIPTWLLPVAGSANYAASANTSATIECSTNNGGSWAACPAGISTTVTNVRLSVGNLAAAANETLTFVVYIP